MLNIIRMDWVKFPWITTLSLAFLFWMIPGSWKPSLVFDILLTFATVIYYWYQEERVAGRNLTCSLPLGRSGYVTGRLLSTWVQIGYIQLILIVVVLIDKALNPEQVVKFEGLFHLRNLMILLSCSSVFLLFFFPIYSRYGGKISRYAYILTVIGSIMLVSGLLLHHGRYESGTETIVTKLVYIWAVSVTYLQFNYPTATNYIITIVILLLLNYATLKLSEKLFLRSNIPQ